MCECSDYIGGFVFMSLFVLFIAILAYKHGFCSGETYAFKRFDRICNECRNKNELVGKIDKFNSCKKCNSSEKSNSRRLI